MVDVPPSNHGHELYPLARDRFVLADVAGLGSHAEVLQAWDKQLQRHVAIKLSLDPTSMDRIDPAELEELGIDDATRAMDDRIIAVVMPYLEGRATPVPSVPTATRSP